MSIFTSHRHVISKVIVLALSYHFVVLCLRLFTKFHKIFSGHFKQVLFCFSVANYHTALATFPVAHIFFIMCQASLYAVISLSVRRQKYGYLSSINRDHFFLEKSIIAHCSFPCRHIFQNYRKVWKEILVCFGEHVLCKCCVDKHSV